MQVRFGISHSKLECAQCFHNVYSSFGMENFFLSASEINLYFFADISVCVNDLFGWTWVQIRRKILMSLPYKFTHNERSGSIALPNQQPSYSCSFVDCTVSRHFGSQAGQFPGQIKKKVLSLSDMLARL